MKSLTYILAACFVLMSCKESAQPETATKTTEATNPDIVKITAEQSSVADIQTGAVTEMALSSKIKAAGIVELAPQDQYSVNVPLGGYVKSLHVMEGSFVKSRQLIAVVEGQQYIDLQQNYLLLINKLQTAESELKRQKLLNESKSVSDKTVEQVEMNYNNLKLELQSTEEKLRMIGISPQNVRPNQLSSKINILSPADGYVRKVNVNTGKYIDPSAALFELDGANSKYLRIKIFERDEPYVQIGQQIAAFSNQNTLKKYPAEIILKGKNYNEDKSLELTCRFNKSYPELIAGAFMNAEIDISGKKCQVLPEDATVSRNQSTYVFIQTDSNTYQLQKVTTGMRENGFIEIVNAEDLKDKTVVLKGAYWLLMQQHKQETGD